MRSIGKLNGSALHASDGEIGRVREAYFDDETWTIRYLVVDTGGWLAGRDVLISPYSVRQPLGGGGIIDVALTRDQVKSSPPIDTHQPVSRQHEREYLDYYGYPLYWSGGSLWAMGAYPVLAPLPASDAERGLIEREVPPEDMHLRSSAAVTGDAIQASDGSIGHVKDFIFDDETWSIRYLVVDTVNWWPGGRKVLVATRWIDRIAWEERKVFMSLTRDAIKKSPEYDEPRLLDRQYEEQLHEAHQREGYWE
jgi:hypothetical protein